MSNEDNISAITVLGSGYVGLTTAALFAAANIKTYLVDVNPERLKSVSNGMSFFYEEGLNKIIKHTVKSGLLIPTLSYGDAVASSHIIVSAVGTPDNTDGSSNLDYVFAAAREAVKYMKSKSIYIQKSTVPVGTGRKVEAIFQKAKVNVSYVSNPEFLREGTALADSLWFDRLVLGGDDNRALSKVINVYKILENRSSYIADMANLKLKNNVEHGVYIRTTLESAELIKVVSNAFLALKISFSNSIAMLTEVVNADIVEVMNAVGIDKRIGNSFLDAGRGYGGGCFPKDVEGLISSAKENGVNLEIMEAAQKINKSMPRYITDKIEKELGRSVKTHTIAVLGLSFKSGTSDARKSPSIDIANILSQKGAKVQTYDPKANDEARPYLKPSIKITDSFNEAIKDADVVIIGTDWREFLIVKPEEYARLMKGKLFVDAMNRFNMSEITAAGLKYLGVGRKSVN